MRKKREQQKQAAAKAEAEKNKSIPGDDKILNILSNTENQRLINNLLGIGRKLGLTGKQNISTSLLPPPPPPPPLPETTNSNNQPATQGLQQTPSQVNMIKPTTSNWSNQQQWGNQQYNPGMEAPGYGPGMPSTMLSTPDVGLSQMASTNFAQPQLNLPSNITPNFSQPPPNFCNNRMQLQNVKAPGPANMKDCPPFSSTDSSTDTRFMHPNDRSLHNFDTQLNFRRGEQERFGRDNANPNLHEQDQFRPPTDSFDKVEAQRFRRGDRNYSDFGNNQLNSQNNFNSGNDRFEPGNDRFSRENNRFGPMGSDRFTSGSDRFGPNNDRPGSDRFNNEWFGQEDERFRPGNDRLGMDNDRRGPENDRFPENERLGSDRFVAGGEQFVPGIDRFDSKDRFFSGNDRFGPNSEHLRSNDRFGRSNTDYFDQKDSTDHRRDSFGTNNRSFNRNPLFSPSNELPPELKKLMEKRKAAGDVFRPSFVDSDKSTSIGSLSESFKKITGDSPFRSSFDFQKNPLNRSGSANSGPSSFQSHSSSDSGQISTSSYGPRGHLFSRDNEPFRGHLDNFAKPIDNNERGKNMETRPYPNQSQPTNIQSQNIIKHPEKIETTESDSSLQTGNIADVKDTETIQANETNNSIEQNDTVISDVSKNDNAEENIVKSDDNSLQQDAKQDDNQIQTNTERIDDSNNNDNIIKQSESLPFMGENDSRPEDLNIEPPPELPNLCSISMNPNQNIPLNPNKDFDRKEPTDNQFDMRFNSNFDSKGIEFKAGQFGPRQPPMCGPRGPRAFPTGPPPGPFLSQGCSMDIQLGLRGPKDGQFRLNVPNESRFSPRRSNDEQYGNRDRNNELSEPSNSEKFDPRGSTNESIGQFGSRVPINAKFGLRGPIERQIGPTDSPFSLRNSSPFEPRGNNLQFGPRGVNERLDFQMSEKSFGPREPNDGLYGPRGPSDVLYGTKRGLSDSQFGTGFNKFDKGNETLLDKRPPFDNSGFFGGFSDEKALGSRKSNEGMTGLRGSNESTSFGPRDSNNVAMLQSNPKNFNENRFEFQDSNNGPFGSSDFKAKGPTNDSTNVNFPPPSDSLVNRGDYMRRNPYIRKEQFEENIFAKRARYESPKPVDEFNKSMDRNLDIEMRKENSEYIRHISDPNKKELEIVPRSGYGPNDTWKDKFGNSQRSDEQHNIDRNVPNTFDERLKSEITMIEPKVSDYKLRYNESTGPDFQSKYASNLFMKRSSSKDGQEFCVQRQFNYNHGESDKKFIESLHFTPAKVIDYGHVSRLSMDQQLSSVQCFDYGHGNLKPTLNREQQQQQYPKKDFRNWVENEQNLKEYTEKMSNYESTKKYTGKTRNYAMNYDMRKSTDYNKRKEHDWQSNDEKIDREKKENDDRKEKGYNPESESRIFERNIDNNQSDRYQNDKNIHKGNLR